MCIIERLFSSSLVALVEMSNPRKLRVCHFKVWSNETTVLEISFTNSISLQKNSEICTYSYPDTILTVKLNRQVLMVACVNATNKQTQ